MNKEEHLIWLYLRLSYYRECLMRLNSDSTESRYLKERIREFEEHVRGIIQGYLPVA